MSKSSEAADAEGASSLLTKIATSVEFTPPQETDYVFYDYDFGRNSDSYKKTTGI